MIDFISVELESSLFESLLNNPLLNFTTPLNEETGEINPTNRIFKEKFAEYNGLKFIIKQYYRDNNIKIELKGSIHKFYANGCNYTDFDLNHLKTALNSLKTLFDIDLETSIIHSIEFGVNINTQIPCSTLLNDLLYYINRKPKEETYQNNGHLISFDLTHYKIKIYNKGLQYYKKGILTTNIENLLRFEIHVNKMQYLEAKKIQIPTLSELVKIENLNKLGVLLTETFNEVVLYDSDINLNVLKPKERDFMIELNNPKKWDEIRKVKKNKYYSRTLTKFRNIIRLNTKFDLHQNTFKKLGEKWELLSKNVPILPPIEIPVMSEYYTNIVCNKETIINRYCIVTGLEITEQKNDSKFLAKTTIDKILMTDKTMYYELLKKYAPKKQTENVNYHIAHNIRNSYFNDSNNLKRRLEKSINQTTLFNPQEVLTLSEEQKELINRFTEFQTIIQ